MNWKPAFLKFTSIVIVFAILIQLTIIMYNHFTGYLILEGLMDFFIRWFIGSALNILVLPLFTGPDLFMVWKLNKLMPWENKWPFRILIEVVTAIIIAITASSVITVLSHLISPYREGLPKLLVTNAMIASVINLMIIIFLEAWIWYRARKQSEEEKSHLETELKSMRFEILKNQINPHFMFNSLNVLSGLVRKDAALAEQFIEAFADVYRYVLETIEKPTVMLSEEIRFARSYFFLQQIRHGQGVDWEIDLPAEFMTHGLPPLSLQLLMENAIKHNAFSVKDPLVISIELKDGLLTVTNHLRKKSHFTHTSGTGLQNLKKRYSYISDQLPSFRISDNEYVAQLPIIEPAL